MKSELRSAEELRQQAQLHIRTNELETAVGLFDEALALTEDPELRELITINKAGALIRMEKSGPEVQLLPQIIMRRRNLRHLCIAAYNLRLKYEHEREFKRALFYAKMALDAAEEMGHAEWKEATLVALGNICVYDSRTEEAIGYYSRVLELAGESDSGLQRPFATQNLGYCYLLTGKTQEGIDLIHSAIDLITAAGAEGYLAEPYIDLCYGYLELGELQLAAEYGERGLERATEVRQVRNAHYLLGEIYYKSGDVERADMHFEHLAKFYPDFPHLKDLLLAIDLRGMVNLKL